MQRGQQKHLPHATHTYGIWNIWYASSVATLCSQFATLSYMQKWQQAVCSHSICHMNILSRWQQAHFMCTVVAIQCSWLVNVHWLPIVATITVWLLSHIIRKNTGRNENSMIVAPNTGIQQILVATRRKSVCVATITLLQQNYLPHGRACVWQLSQSFDNLVAAWESLIVATIIVISVS